jgi:selenocysteine-specific elongation factor
MILATAGHIDHGKTALVQALTGVDADRLPEEKRRGLTIDLGFAYATLPNGGEIGFVDVPGHERFLPNMLAGVMSIDRVLLVVAADDGPRPQTIEHLDILELIEVAEVTGVVTKIDRVPPERAATVVVMPTVRFSRCRAILATASLRSPGICRKAPGSPSAP